MTLHPIAQHLAAQGRGEDSLLVHMTPREVAGLDALARQRYGHGLPTNPHTGLPEASLLGGFLPAILGIGGMMMGIPPIWSAALVGGGTALATGSFGKGLMAGIGAYGGSELGAGFSGAADAPASSIGSDMASGSGIGAENALEQGGGWSPATTMGNTATDVAPEAADFGGENSLEQAGGWSPAGDMSGMGAGPAGVSSPDVQPLSASQLSSSSPSAVTNPSLFSKEGMQAYMDKVGGGKKLMRYGMMALAPAMSEMMQPKMPSAAQTGGNGLLRPYRYNPQGQTYSALPTIPAAQANSLAFYAQGGAVDGYASGGIGTLPGVAGQAEQDAMNKAAPFMDGGKGVDPTAPMRPTYTYDHTTQRFTPIPMPVAPTADTTAPMDPSLSVTGMGIPFGRDFNDSAGYAEGGGIGSPRLLRGPGDGVSDSIPAHIGERPAALGDGEYVVPSRIVSELGNGSTDAGARRLDEMVQRVQQLRGKTTGGPRSRVAVDSQAYKALPA